MPSKPLRQVLVEAVTAAFQAITPGATYTNDLSQGQVFEWKTAPFDDDELPGINIMDGDQVIGDSSLGSAPMGKSWSALPFMVSCAVKVPTPAATNAQVAAVARTLQADLLVATGVGAVAKWGINNTWTKVTGFGIDVQGGEKTIAYAYVQFEISFQHPRFDISS